MRNRRCLPDMRSSDLFHTGTQQSGTPSAHRHALGRIVCQMANKIFNSPTNFSQQRGDWLAGEQSAFGGKPKLQVARSSWEVSLQSASDRVGAQSLGQLGLAAY